MQQPQADQALSWMRLVNDAKKHLLRKGSKRVVLFSQQMLRILKVACVGEGWGPDLPSYQIIIRPQSLTIPTGYITQEPQFPEMECTVPLHSLRVLQPQSV